MGSRNNEVLLSEGLWPAIQKLPRGRTPIRAAIAYYSRDLLELQSGDLLVVNASDDAVRAGITSGKELLRLHKLGVQIHSVEWLHAKVISIGEKVVVGSANASANSMHKLKEAAIITGSLRMRTQVISFVVKTAAAVEPMTLEEAKRLAAIKVVRTELPFKSRPKENQPEVPTLWWISTGPLSEALAKKEQRDVTNGLAEAREAVGDEHWQWDVLRYRPSDRYAQRLKLNDIVVQAYSDPFGDANTTEVHSPAVIVHIKKADKWVRFYLKSIYPRWRIFNETDARQALSKVSTKPPTVSTTRKLSDEEFAALEDIFSCRRTKKKAR